MSDFKLPNVHKGVVFTVRAPFAHFRKFYSQTSALSYPIPPRTVLAGIVGAILGIPRCEVYELMQPPNGFFALQILTPVRKVTSTVNLLSTKKEFLKEERIKFFDSTENRTQIPMEILVPKPPSHSLKFRIAFWHKEKKLLEKLAGCLSESKSFYPVYLGISEFLAVTQFEGLTESLIELRDYEGEIHSVIVSGNVESRVVKPGNKFNVEYMLIYMNKDFSAKAHTNVIYSEQAKPVSLKVKYAMRWKDTTWTPYELFDN